MGEEPGRLRAEICEFCGFAVVDGLCCRAGREHRATIKTGHKGRADSGQVTAQSETPPEVPERPPLTAEPERLRAAIEEGFGVTDREPLSLDDSPLGRATRDPVAALALLAEAVSRGETQLASYVLAANAAIAHVDAHGFIRPPKGEPAEVADVFVNSPSPGELYAQTGGGKEYIDAMIAHGYIVKKGRGSE